MRGGVTLAAALAIPLETDSSAPFDDRALIIFLAFSVVLGTLVVQGLTLPGLVSLLGLEEDTDELQREESLARIRASEAALERLEELVEEDWVRPDTAERIRGLYNFRSNRFRARLDGADEGGIEEQSVAFQRLRYQLLEAERAAVFALRNEGEISEEVMQTVLRDLDLEESRLDV
jgi:CPA1 family monovalent cation:H+ antiporter